MIDVLIISLVVVFCIFAESWFAWRLARDPGIVDELQRRLRSLDL